MVWKMMEICISIDQHTHTHTSSRNRLIDRQIDRQRDRQTDRVRCHMVSFQLFSNWIHPFSQFSQCLERFLECESVLSKSRSHPADIDDAHKVHCNRISETLTFTTNIAFYSTIYICRFSHFCCLLRFSSINCYCIIVIAHRYITFYIILFYFILFSNRFLYTLNVICKL